jgi:hypothetical protein
MENIAVQDLVPFVLPSGKNVHYSANNIGKRICQSLFSIFDYVIWKNIRRNLMN